MAIQKAMQRSNKSMDATRWILLEGICNALADLKPLLNEIE